MIDLTPLKDGLGGNPIAVFGLGKTGQSVVRACEAAGIETLAWDDNEKHRANVSACWS